MLPERRANAKEYEQSWNVVVQLLRAATSLRGRLRKQRATRSKFNDCIFCSPFLQGQGRFPWTGSRVRKCPLSGKSWKADIRATFSGKLVYLLLFPAMGSERVTRTVVF